MNFLNLFKRQRKPEFTPIEDVHTSFSIKNKVRVKSIGRDKEKGGTTPVKIPKKKKAISDDSVGIEVDVDYSPCKSGRYSVMPSSIGSLPTTNFIH